jgi:hypothetical protein
MTPMADEAWQSELTVVEETPQSWTAANDLAAFLNRDSRLRVRSRHLMGPPEWIAPAVEVIAVYIGTTIARRGIDSVVDHIVESAISWARSALQRERRGWRGRLTLGLVNRRVATRIAPRTLVGRTLRPATSQAIAVFLA